MYTPEVVKYSTTSPSPFRPMLCKFRNHRNHSTNPQPFSAQPLPPNAATAPSTPSPRTSSLLCRDIRRGETCWHVLARVSTCHHMLAHVTTCAMLLAAYTIRYLNNWTIFERTYTPGLILLFASFCLLHTQCCTLTFDVSSSSCTLQASSQDHFMHIPTCCTRAIISQPSNYVQANVYFTSCYTLWVILVAAYTMLYLDDQTVCRVMYTPGSSQNHHVHYPVCCIHNTLSRQSKHIRSDVHSRLVQEYLHALPCLLHTQHCISKITLYSRWCILQASF